LITELVPYTLDTRNNTVSTYDPTKDFVRSCIEGGVAGGLGGIGGVVAGCALTTLGKYTADVVTGEAFERRKLTGTELGSLDPQSLALLTSLQKKGGSCDREVYEVTSVHASHPARSFSGHNIGTG